MVSQHQQQQLLLPLLLSSRPASTFAFDQSAALPNANATSMYLLFPAGTGQKGTEASTPASRPPLTMGLGLLVGGGDGTVVGSSRGFNQILVAAHISTTNGQPND
jgi:hypothetical protein